MRQRAAVCYFGENPTVMVECGFSYPDEAALPESEGIGSRKWRLIFRIAAVSWRKSRENMWKAQRRVMCRK